MDKADPASMDKLKEIVDRIKRLRDAYGKVFDDSPEARLVLDDLKIKGHFMVSCAAINPVSSTIDPLLMAYRDGERHMILEVLRMREPLDPELALAEILKMEQHGAYDFLHDGE